MNFYFCLLCIEMHTFNQTHENNQEYTQFESDTS